MRQVMDMMEKTTTLLVWIEIGILKKRSETGYPLQESQILKKPLIRKHLILVYLSITYLFCFVLFKKIYVRILLCLSIYHTYIISALVGIVEVVKG